MVPNDFRAFYEAHFHFAWRVLRRLGARDDELPDLLQEVFLVAHRKLPEFEGRGRVTTWLFSICHNVLRAARRRRREQPLPADPSSESATTGASREDVLSARQLLLALPEEQRVVFLLFELEGLSGDEIAETLSIPVGTVRSRLRLARESFRSALDVATRRLEGVGYRNV
jgi:RNA polymerase sigma-70 factor, ECF subfamily